MINLPTLFLAGFVFQYSGGKVWEKHDGMQKKDSTVLLAQKLHVFWLF